MKESLRVITNKVFCDGTWKHKYNESKNLRIEEAIGEPNDRTAYDVGEEPNHYEK